MLHNSRRRAQQVLPFISTLAVKCTPYVKKPEKFLKRHITEKKTKGNTSVRHFRRSYMAYIATLFFLCRKEKIDDKERMVSNVDQWLVRSQDWCSKHQMLFGAYASSFALLASLLDHSLFKVSCVGLSLILLIVALTRRKPTHTFNLYQPALRSINFFTASLFACCCISLVFLVIGPISNVMVSTIFVRICPTLCFLLGISLINSSMPRFIESEDFIPYRIRKNYTFHQEIDLSHSSRFVRGPLSFIINTQKSLICRRHILYYLILLFLTIISPFYLGSESITRLSLVVSIFMGCITVALNIMVLWGHIVVQKASVESDHFLRNEVEKLEAKNLH